MHMRACHVRARFKSSGPRPTDCFELSPDHKFWACRSKPIAADAEEELAALLKPFKMKLYRRDGSVELQTVDPSTRDVSPIFSAIYEKLYPRKGMFSSPRRQAGTTQDDLPRTFLPRPKVDFTKVGAGDLGFRQIKRLESMVRKDLRQLDALLGRTN